MNCSGDKPDVAPNPNVLPTDYRQDIINAVRSSLDDPTGIREASISEPALRPSGVETRYLVCLRYNAKRSDGSYAGARDRAAVFYGGKLTTITEATREMCGGVPMQPFPELEKLCREIVCPKR